MLQASSNTPAQHSPMAKNYLAPNVNSAEKEKPWVTGKENNMFKVIELFKGLEGVEEVIVRVWSRNVEFMKAIAGGEAGNVGWNQRRGFYAKQSFAPQTAKFFWVSWRAKLELSPSTVLFLLYHAASFPATL